MDTDLLPSFSCNKSPLHSPQADFDLPKKQVLHYHWCCYYHLYIVAARYKQSAAANISNKYGRSYYLIFINITTMYVTVKAKTQFQ